MPHVKGSDGEIHLTTFEDSSTGLCGIPLDTTGLVDPAAFTDFSDVHQKCQDAELDNAKKREAEGRRRAGVSAYDLDPSGTPSMEEALEEADRRRLDNLYDEPPHNR